MFALVAAILFIIAAVKQGHTDTAIFWVYLGLAAWALHFFIDPWLTPYYPARRTRTRNVP
jgi:hypothetical protein